MDKPVAVSRGNEGRQYVAFMGHVYKSFRLMAMRKEQVSPHFVRLVVLYGQVQVKLAERDTCMQHRPLSLPATAWKPAKDKECNL